MMSVPKTCRILAFWAGSDFDAFLKPAFLGRPDLEVEIVSSRRVGTDRPYAAGIARTRLLRGRLRAGEFDLVIAGNIWRSRVPKHKGFFTRMAKLVRNSTVKRSSLDTDLVPGLMSGMGVPLAAIDIRDSHFVKPWDLPLLRASTVYFKRELFAVPERSLFDLMTWERAGEIQPLTAKLRPLSYGIDPARIPAKARPMAERDVDIFMSGGGKPLRDPIKERVRALSGKYRVVVADGKVSDADYFELLQRSKLVICTESFGCETWRQYEVSAAGGIPVINYPFVLHYQPMEPDEHAIFFSLAGQDLEKQIVRALGNPDFLQQLSTRTRAWTLACKQRPTIANYIIAETLRQHRVDTGRDALGSGEAPTKTRQSEKKLRWDFGSYSFPLLGRVRGVVKLEKSGASRLVTMEPSDIFGGHAPTSVSLPPLKIAEFYESYATHQGSCITRDGFLVEEISQYLQEPIEKHRQLHSSRPFRRIVRVPGPVVCLASPCQYNYYHWMLEVLPKIELFRVSSAVPVESTFYAETHQPFQRESLRIAGVPSNSLLNSRETQVIWADRLFVATIPAPSGVAHPWAVDWLRRTILPGVTSKEAATPLKCLVVTRRDAKNRRLINEEEMLQMLAPLQPVVAKLEELTFLEQVSLFSRAELIIAPHGAGLTNLAFARRESHVVEMFPASCPNPCYQKLAEVVGIRYTALVCEDSPDTAREMNMRVDVRALENLIR